MRERIRQVIIPAVVALTLAVSVGAGVYARATASAYQPRVVIVDNDGSFTPGDPGTGMWGFSPAHLTVTKGETIVFDNPAGNFRPHSVTSLRRTGMAPTFVWESGTLFDSSPTPMELIRVGMSYTLDTTDLNPGTYVYYCNLHPWMVGSITVTPAP